jgi:hypothetical protein
VGFEAVLVLSRLGKGISAPKFMKPGFLIRLILIFVPNLRISIVQRVVHVMPPLKRAPGRGVSQIMMDIDVRVAFMSKLHGVEPSGGSGECIHVEIE